MTEVVQLVISGLAIGCIYALIGLGFVFTINSVGVINLAHGEILMLGAFFAVTYITQVNLPLWFAYGLAVVSTIALGFLLHLAILRHIISKPFFTMLVATMGLSITLSNVAMNVFTSETVNLPGPFGPEVVRLGSIIISKHNLLVMSMTGVIFLIQWWFFSKTTTGRQMRAMADNPEVARLVGIPVGKLTALTFMLSAGLAGIAGVLLAPIYYVRFTMGGLALVKGFTASIIGGFGKVTGVVLGGLTMGVLETLMAAYVSPTFKDGFVFIALVLVLFIRPQGILGEQKQERV